MAHAYTLYGTGFSLYTGKARAYLRYKGIPYRERLSTLRVYKQVIVPKTGVHFIPVLESPDGAFVQDTTDIIDFCEARFGARGVYPATPCQRIVARLIELYADEWLVIPAMHYRWNFPEQNEAFLMAEFGRLVLPHAPAVLRRRVARRNAKRFAGMLPILGVNARTAPAIEAAWHATLDDLQAHFSVHRYVLGERASIADFGLIAPLYAHLYRDPAPGALMRERAPAVAAWVERMFEDTPAVGDWPADDTVPETLLPILQRQFTEQFPVLRETVAAVAQWAAAHPGEKLPRRVGTHTFRIGDATGKRALMPYPQWMLQRVLDDYARLNDADRARLDTLLAHCGAGDALHMPIGRRIERRDNRLWPATT